MGMMREYKIPGHVKNLNDTLNPGDRRSHLNFNENTANTQALSFN